MHIDDRGRDQDIELVDVHIVKVAPVSARWTCPDGFVLFAIMSGGGAICQFLSSTKQSKTCGIWFVTGRKQTTWEQRDSIEVYGIDRRKGEGPEVGKEAETLKQHLRLDV